ncbi:hypothetical protein [Saccharothrix hoggarensis]
MARSGVENGSGERRGRGLPAVAVLRSEDDFTDPGLSRERRWLALFLLVHLVDEHGRMSTAYRRVLKRAAREPGHWAQGRSLGAVRAEVSRWIGANARADSRPPWNRIADVVDAAVHPRFAPGVRATARYLYALATGEPADEAHRPHWLHPAAGTVTTSLIGGPEWAAKHSLPLAVPEPRPPEPATKPAAKPGAEPAAEPAAGLAAEPTAMPAAGLAAKPATEPAAPLAAEPAVEDAVEDAEEDGAFDPEWSAYNLLWTVVRAHRDAQHRIALLEHQVRELHEENARLSGDVTSWLGGYRPAIPDQERRTREPRPVADRHLAAADPPAPDAPADPVAADPGQVFTYPLPAELPAARVTS